MRRHLILLCTLALVGVLAAGCAADNQGGGAGNAPTPAPTPTATPSLQPPAGSTPPSGPTVTLVGEVQAYVIDQAYTIPIFEEPQAFAASPRLKDFSFEAVGRPSFYAAWLAPK